MKKALGAIITVPAVISTTTSFLKMIYFRLDDGLQMGSMLACPFKQIVYWIYENTQFLGFFWSKSPTPNHMNLSEPQNIPFLAIYFTAFVGLAFYASGRKLAVRLNKISEEIENQLLKESLRGERVCSREEIERLILAPSNSIFSKIHQLYLAPVVTAVIGTIIIS